MLRVKFFLLSCLFAQSLSLNAFAQDSVLSAEETRFYQLINSFRQKLNLPTLEMQPLLEAAARKHSEWMASQNFLSHYGPINDFTPFQRMKQEGYANYSYAGENIACGNGDAIKTFRQWAFSPSHLSNMLSPHFHQMGIARAGTGNENCPYYWTNDFGSVTNPNLDPPSVVDANLISQAIAAVSGDPNAPVAIQLNATENSNTAPTNSNTNGVKTPSILQCMIPSALGKGILTYYLNTDTLITATQTANDSTLTLAYYQNGQTANLSSIVVSGAQVITNPDFPMVTLFSMPGNRVGGFSIQVNTATNEGQFNSYGTSPVTTGKVLCTMKY